MCCCRWSVLRLTASSSVLYGSVPDLVEPAWRQRAFSILYRHDCVPRRIACDFMVCLATRSAYRRRSSRTAAVVLVTLPITLMLRPVLVATAGLNVNGLALWP